MYDTYNRIHIYIQMLIDIYLEMPLFTGSIKNNIFDKLKFILWLRNVGCKKIPSIL